ncbi:WXG100 family type VII secretion target [Nocardia sp. NPDC051832]|uniref:WXG100 family type VII secretion target n=1 Tax=Nocardia sp. NPDC051832 TaxID=3155673 RepID=UPI003423126B
MSSVVKYNFVAIEASGARLQVIVNGMQSNSANIHQLKTELLASADAFTGQAAEAYNEIASRLDTQLRQYDETLARLRSAIVDAGKLMEVTDTNNRNLFFST